MLRVVLVFVNWHFHATSLHVGKPLRSFPPLCTGSHQDTQARVQEDVCRYLAGRACVLLQLLLWLQPTHPQSLRTRRRKNPPFPAPVVNGLNAKARKT